MRMTFRFWGITLFTTLFLTNCTKDEDPTRNPPVANAGESQIIQLPAASATLTGSGTTENFKITGYLWSLVSGPNVPVIANESSPTAVVSGFVEGNYIFQLLVIDSAGLSDADTVSWLVKPNPQRSLSLQPTKNINEGHITDYYNTPGLEDTEIPVTSWVYGSPIIHRGLLKFDFSAIPANSTILSAELFLYAMPNPHGGDMLNAHSGTANACYVERKAAGWTFTGMTWANQPATVTANRAVIPQSTLPFQDNIIDVKGMVQDMQANGNYGFKIRLQNEVSNNARQYASSYHINASLHPKLVITYQ